MRIIVSDTSCFIDLQKGGILPLIFRLPFRFIMPTELYEYELLSFDEKEKQYLKALGLELSDLDGDQMKRVQKYWQKDQRLSVRDCYALTLAETTEDAILLTGDHNLKKSSEALFIETHGVLWLFDQLTDQNYCTPDNGLVALDIWLVSPSVYLPEGELRKRIRKLSS